MNTYETEFFAICPVNESRVKYTLRIESPEVISVEHINDEVMLAQRGLHEELADALHHSLGGAQKLSAFHHGVRIETLRGFP